ncbi:MAG: hypothetical protein AB1630_11970 [bacterium]
MKFNEILENARKREITREEALYLLQQANDSGKLLKLLEVSSNVRNETVGKTFKN